MRSEHITELALNAIQFIAGDERLLTGFMQMAGLSPDELRHRIAEPELQGGVLDFMLSEDAIILAFCEAFGHRPQDVIAARRHLPGASLDEY